MSCRNTGLLSLRSLSSELTTLPESDTVVYHYTCSVKILGMILFFIHVMMCVSLYLNALHCSDCFDSLFDVTLLVHSF